MSTGAVLQVDQVSKKFSRGLRGALWYGAQDIASEVAWWRGRAGPRLRDGEFWALRDISFALRAGESLGVIGGNGAGKSTLLKLLTGLMKPDAGRITVRGRVRAMIELGAAFNPLLSGRENIFAQASLYGYSRRDLVRQLDAIIDFAAIGEFIDSPVQHYSNGMRARLGFAIAAQLSPDVLLVDEVLAVGDIGFQNKCLQHMRSYLVQGGALVFVGHASHQVQSVCQRGLVLTSGECTFSGDVVGALDVYLRQQRSGSGAETHVNGVSPSESVVTPEPLSEERLVRINALSMAATDGEGIISGGSVRLTMRYAAFRRIPDVSFSFAIFTQDGSACVGGGLPAGRVTLEEGEHELRCVVPRLPLFGGTYQLRANLFDEALESPLAISGWSDAPQRFVVHAATTSKNNLRSLMGMHVDFHVEWE